MSAQPLARNAAYLDLATPSVVEPVEVDYMPTDAEIEDAMLVAAYDEMTGAVPVIPSVPDEPACGVTVGYLHVCRGTKHMRPSPFRCSRCLAAARAVSSWEFEARLFVQKCLRCGTDRRTCSC